MTKPNELTLEKALDRMQRVLEGWEGKENDPNQLAAALRLVIEAAREAVTVNPETPRAKHLKRLKELRRSHAKWATWPRPEQLQQQSAGCAESLQWAIDELSALSLASPFTREWLGCLQHMLRSPEDCWDDEDRAALAKLDAYIESRRGGKERLPFTNEDLEWFSSWGHYCRANQSGEEELESTEALDKLDAYLDRSPK